MCVRRPLIVVPTPMPARATPTGRPMASTEPNARIRMTMAKARPRTSDDGASNSAKIDPPSRMSTPSTCGITRPSDLLRPLLGVGADDAQLTAAGRLDLVDLREQVLHGRLHGRVVDALVGLEDDRAADTGALAAEVLDRKSTRLNSSHANIS